MAWCWLYELHCRRWVLRKRSWTHREDTASLLTHLTDIRNRKYWVEHFPLPAVVIPLNKSRSRIHNVYSHDIPRVDINALPKSKRLPLRDGGGQSGDRMVIRSKRRLLYECRCFFVDVLILPDVSADNLSPGVADLDNDVVQSLWIEYVQLVFLYCWNKLLDRILPLRIVDAHQKEP